MSIVAVDTAEPSNARTAWSGKSPVLSWSVHDPEKLGDATDCAAAMVRPPPASVTRTASAQVAAR
jgi:hypothetical protein